MQQLVLVRHAAASGQEPHAALTPDGERQAHSLAALIAPYKVERVISSPWVRAVESARPFCIQAGLQLETDERLIERTLSTRALPDWQQHLRRSFDEPDYCFDDGESARTAQARGLAAVSAALETRDRCVLVTHGNLLALILKSIDQGFGFDEWSRLSNPDVFLIRADGDRLMEFSRVWR